MGRSRAPNPTLTLTLALTLIQTVGRDRMQWIEAERLANVGVERGKTRVEYLAHQCAKAKDTCEGQRRVAVPAHGRFVKEDALRLRAEERAHLSTYVCA